MKRKVKFIMIIFFLALGLFLVLLLTNKKNIVNEKPKPSLKVHFNEIVYTEEPNIFSTLFFINENGGEKSESDIVFPVYDEKNIFGKVRFQIYYYISNNDASAYWSNDGMALGFLFSRQFPNVVYPGLLAAEDELYVCLSDETLYTNYQYPIQTIDRNRIVINIGRYPDNYLSLYNMKECKEESVYYDGNLEGNFAISSQDWLAIEEGLGNDVKLNIYNEDRNLILSNNETDNYPFFTWSKDGTKIVYRILNSTYDDQFYMYDFSNGETKLIGEDISTASFSPDGNKLVIERAQAKLYILNLDTMEEILLTNGSKPDWRP